MNELFRSFDHLDTKAANAAHSPLPRKDVVFAGHGIPLFVQCYLNHFFPTFSIVVV